MHVWTCRNGADTASRTRPSNSVVPTVTNTRMPRHKVPVQSHELQHRIVAGDVERGPGRIGTAEDGRGRCPTTCAARWVDATRTVAHLLVTDDSRGAGVRPVRGGVVASARIASVPMPDCAIALHRCRCGACRGPSSRRDWQSRAAAETACCCSPRPPSWPCSPIIIRSAASSRTSGWRRRGGGGRPGMLRDRRRAGTLAGCVRVGCDVHRTNHRGDGGRCKRHVQRRAGAVVLAPGDQRPPKLVHHIQVPRARLRALEMLCALRSVTSESPSWNVVIASYSARHCSHGPGAVVGVSKAASDGNGALQ